MTMGRIALLLAAAATATPPGAATDEGRLLFQFGEADAPVAMSLPGDRSFGAARAMPCASCHGYDGGGVAETRPPPLAIVAATAQSDAAFKRVLGEGIGPDGRRLRLMPRYAMNVAQRDALAAYLGQLDRGSEAEPGLSADLIRVDVSGLAAAQANGLRAAAQASRPSVYGRGILFVTDPGAAFARLGRASRANPAQDGRTAPLIALSSQRAGSAAATLAYLTELFGRAGRRLTRPGLIAVLVQADEGVE